MNSRLKYLIVYLRSLRPVSDFFPGATCMRIGETAVKNTIEELEAALPCPVCKGLPCCLEGTPKGQYISGAHSR
jgi:hypothetical protein